MKRSNGPDFETVGNKGAKKRESHWDVCKAGPCFGMHGQKFGLCMTQCIGRIKH